MPTAPLADSLHRLAGTSISNYRILEPIGSGGYGMVYRGLDLLSSGNLYAIKCMVKVDSDSRHSVLQRRELALQGLVRHHPNIVHLHEILSDKNHVYAVLQYFEEGDLFTAIVDRQVYLHKDALIKVAFIQLLDALGHCHSLSVYHRDIKPENVMCARAGTRVFLGDFGLATTSPISSKFGCGSRYYMSPECINEELRLRDYSLPESDLWSLGVILYNLVSMQNPWRFATTQDDHFCTFLHDPLFFRRTLRLSNEANHIFHAMFALNPTERIGISELRRKIVALSTFYMMEGEELAVEEIATSTPKIVLQVATGSSANSSLASTSASLRLRPAVVSCLIGCTICKPDLSTPPLQSPPPIATALKTPRAVPEYSSFACSSYNLPELDTSTGETAISSPPSTSSSSSRRILFWPKAVPRLIASVYPAERCFGSEEEPATRADGAEAHYFTERIKQVLSDERKIEKAKPNRMKRIFKRVQVVLRQRADSTIDALTR